MPDIYKLLKSLLDPLVFILVLAAIAILFLIKGRNKRIGKILLVLPFFILYSAGLSPVAHMMSYIVEKDCLPKERETDGTVDIVVVLGGGVFYST